MPGASLRSALAAVGFLTRIPVPRRVRLDAADVGRGAALFPLVGAGSGALVGLVAVGLDGPLPPLVAGAVAVGAGLLMTGALHLDALADTADALGAGTRERALEVMRDSRIGTFGAAAIGVDLIVRAAAVAALADAWSAVALLAAAGALSRASSVPLAFALPYARAEGGPGSVLSGRVSAPVVALAAALGVVLAVTLAGWDGVIAIGAAAVVAACGGLGCRRWLGGVTGDALGAVTEVVEIAVIVLLVGLR